MTKCLAENLHLTTKKLKFWQRKGKSYEEMIEAKICFCQFYCSCHFGAELKCDGAHIVAGTAWERDVELPSVDEHGTSALGSAEVAGNDVVVESREKAKSVSGRCGGVTGVLAGVHI